MAGIRIQNIPVSVTDKQLKAYFSNPKHGGGSIHRLYYPMPNNSAVVIYDDNNDAQQVLLKKHKVGEERLVIRALPRHVYHAAMVQVEKDVSQFMSLNPDIVDELQYVGELNVEFSYEREAYLLTGGWYQLEWALHHIDSMLDVFEFDKRAKTENQKQDEDSEEESVTPEIKKSNIPMVSDNEQKRDERNFTDFVTASPVSLSKTRKNKNSAPLMPGESLMGSLQPDMLKNNLDQAAGYHSSISGATGMKARGNQLNGDDDTDVEFFAKHKNLLTTSPQRPRSKRAAQFDPTVGFGDMNRQVPFFMPNVTKGISVAHTDFGNAPTTFEFTIGQNLNICIAKDSITKQTTDCIVNATSRDLGNLYGISRAIVKAAGNKLQVDCYNYLQEHGSLETMHVMHTFGGGNLDPRIKFILHTAGPEWLEDNSEEGTHALVCTYINCIQYADIKLQLKSIAIPLISAGTYGFPLDLCVQAFYDAILLMVSSSTQKRHIRDVKLICFDDDTTMAVIATIQSLLDCDLAQSICAAVDRYRSNISQHGFGAENFMVSEDMVSDISVAIKPQEEKPSNQVPRARKNKNSEPYTSFLQKTEDYGATKEVKQDQLLTNRAEAGLYEWQDLKPKEKVSNVSVGDDDDDDDKGEKDDVDEESSDVHADTTNDRKLENVAYGISESYGRKHNTNFEPESDLSIAFGTPVEHQDDEEGDTEEAHEGYERGGLEDLETRDENSDEEGRKYDKRTETDADEGAHGEAEENSTEDTVTKLASLLENIDTDYKDGNNSGNAEVEAIDMTTGASGHDTDTEDEDSCASVGGSMVKIEKADVEHFDE